MTERELKKIAAIYFGITPTSKLSKSVDIEILSSSEIEGDIENAKRVKIKWESHIGSEGNLARITPLDVMYYLRMKNTKENYKKAVKILKGLAKLNNLPLVKVGEKYLLINPKHRR